MEQPVSSGRAPATFMGICRLSRATGLGFLTEIYRFFILLRIA